MAALVFVVKHFKSDLLNHILIFNIFSCVGPVVSHQGWVWNFRQRARPGASVSCHVDGVDAVGLAGCRQGWVKLLLRVSCQICLGDDQLFAPNAFVAEKRLVL